MNWYCELEIDYWYKELWNKATLSTTIMRAIYKIDPTKLSLNATALVIYNKRLLPSSKRMMHLSSKLSMITLSRVQKRMPGWFHFFAISLPFDIPPSVVHLRKLSCHEHFRQAEKGVPHDQVQEGLTLARPSLHSRKITWSLFHKPPAVFFLTFNGVKINRNIILIVIWWRRWRFEHCIRS